MKQLSLSLLQRLPFCAFILLALYVSLFWLSCRKDDAPPEFPKLFKFDPATTSGGGRAYWKNSQGIGVPLLRSQSGTFISFLDTINYYDQQQTLPLAFTGIELLNDYQVRIFSDGSSGTLPLDTVVRYSATSAGIITISWTPLAAPVSLEMYDIVGQEYMKFFSNWLVYSYRTATAPDLPQYTLARHYYTEDALGKALSIMAVDGFSYDTMAIYSRFLEFRR